MGKPLTYDHLKSSKKPVYKSVWIALDPELADEEADLKQKASALRIRQTARPNDEKTLQDLADVEQKLEAATAALRENSVKFTFRSIGRRRYDDLLSDHQPTPEHIAEAKKMDPQAGLDFNPDTFPQALIAASIHEPKLTKDEVNDLFQSDDWSGAELSALFEAALVANTTRRIIDLGNASRGTNGSSSN
jgi:hypothetical protein